MGVWIHSQIKPQRTRSQARGRLVKGRSLTGVDTQQCIEEDRLTVLILL